MINWREGKLCLDTPAKVAAYNQAYDQCAKLGDTVRIPGKRISGPKKKGPSRYGVKRITHIDGTKLDSGRELARYCELLLMAKGNVIKDLEVHPRIPIIIAGTPIKIRSKRYPNGRMLTYVADFRYDDNERKLTVVEDVKMASGHRTEVYRIKKALVHAMGIIIEEIT